MAFVAAAAFGRLNESHQGFSRAAGRQLRHEIFLGLPNRHLTKYGRFRYVCRAFGGRPSGAAFLFCALAPAAMKSRDQELDR
jgi:hypothetical protein